MSVKWIARTPPKRQVEGSNPSGPVPILVLLCRFLACENRLYGKEIAIPELDPWNLFLNAMRAPMTRDRYQTRVAKFFDFIKIPGKTLEQRARTFAKKGKKD